METSWVFAHVYTHFSSYRTYEEWKPDWNDDIPVYVFGSYRTYEEWKHRLLNSSNDFNFGFLPYLWGMETLTRKKIYDNI